MEVLTVLEVLSTPATKTIWAAIKDRQRWMWI